MRANGDPPPVAEAVCDASDFAASDVPTIYGVPGEPGFRREPPASPDASPDTGAEVFWRFHDAKQQFESAAMRSDNLNELTRLKRRMEDARREVTRMVQAVYPSVVDVGFGHAVEWIGPPMGFNVRRLVPAGVIVWPPGEDTP